MLDFVRSLLPQGPVWGPFLFGAGIYEFRYLAFAAWYGRRVAPPGKVQGTMPGLPQLAREIAWSVVAVIVFGLVNVVIYGYGIVRHTELYNDIAQYGSTYFWISIPLMIVLHDTCFYCTHSLMHTRPLP